MLQQRIKQSKAQTSDTWIYPMVQPSLKCLCTSMLELANLAWRLFQLLPPFAQICHYWGPILLKVLKMTHFWYKKMCFRNISKGQTKMDFYQSRVQRSFGCIREWRRCKPVTPGFKGKPGRESNVCLDQVSHIWWLMVQKINVTSLLYNRSYV